MKNETKKPKLKITQLSKREILKKAEEIEKKKKKIS